jgi:hypothetical protein
VGHQEGRKKGTRNRLCTMAAGVQLDARWLRCRNALKETCDHVARNAGLYNHDSHDPDVSRHTCSTCASAVLTRPSAMIIAWLHGGSEYQ